MSTSNAYLINITRKRDMRDFGDWKTVSEWASDSAEVFTRDSYEGPRRSLGSVKTVNTLTATRSFYSDMDADVIELDLEVGSGEIFIVTKQRLLRGGAVDEGYRTRTRDCTLKSLSESAVDVGADDPEVDVITIELTPEG